MFPLKDANPRHGPAFVTWALLAVNIAVFAWSAGAGERVFFDYGFIPRLFFSEPLGEWSRLLSSMFLHGNLVHVAGNMFFLWVFGDNIEDRFGHLPFLIFYLLGGAVAAIMHGLFEASSPVPMVGASGAVSAVLGAYIVLFPGQRVLTFVPPFFLLWLPAWFYLGYWAFIQLFQGATGLFAGAASQGGVAWWAHVGGFVFGMLLVRRLAKPPPYLSSRR
ncbi:MAG: rhomboid family intramembrane serine protease [Deinococcota bacterium]|nr:rhomboid family intramembrane serine protease [Deinococcota bacterium]